MTKTLAALFLLTASAMPLAAQDLGTLGGTGTHATGILVGL